MTTSGAIYAVAKTYLGLHEVLGPSSNPVIKDIIRETADWLDLDDSKTAWCGCFRRRLGKLTNTGWPKDAYRAKTWLDWGKTVSLKDAVQGDTVVLVRAGGFHVTLFSEIEGNFIHCLGGNQADAVTYGMYEVKNIVGIRRALT